MTASPRRRVVGFLAVLWAARGRFGTSEGEG
uniref:Uncharacterized protein n=1 Tax=Arundo donax TaxID=35708 RepID=A0A0A9AU04_ARUDO